MPTIKISTETKNKLEALMAQDLQNKISKAKAGDKPQIFMQIVQKKYGITFDQFLNQMIDQYTRYTK